MNFLFPFTLILGLLLPVIAVLYLRRPRRREMEVSTLLFWRSVLERAPHRRFLGRLRNPFSLLLQLLIFLLLLLALARPEWGSVPGGQSTVIVLDTRARMQADGGAAFRAAQDAARGLVTRAGPDHEIAVLTAEGNPRIVSPFSRDARDLRERLNSLTPSDAGGDLSATLLLAERLLEGRRNTTNAVLISDRPAEEAANFEQVLVGQPRDNTAILALAQRPLPASPQSAEIFARLANFSATAREVEMELSLDGRAIALKPFRLPAGDTEDFSTVVPAEVLRSGKGLLTARLLEDDALATDNTARAALSTAAPLRVLLLTENNPFLEGALKADPGLAVEILTPSAWRAELAAGFDAVLFDNWRPEETGALTELPGNFFFFGRSPWESDPEDPGSVNLEVTNPRSPLLWNVDLTGLRPVGIRPLQVPQGWRASVPVEADGRPALLSLQRPGGARMVATAFAVDSSAFPLRVGFPIFVSNVLHWLANRETTGGTGYRAGQTFVPATGESLVRQETKPPAAGSTGPVVLRNNGFYEVRAGDSSRWIAVNTTDAAESDLRPAQANRNRLILRGAGLSLQPWQWLALAAFFLLVLEWAFHHRRITE